MRNEDHCHFWRKRRKEIKRQICWRQAEGWRKENSGWKWSMWTIPESIEAILKLSSTYWPPLQRMLADYDSWHWGWCRFDVHTWPCESSSPSLQGSDRQQSTWKTTSAVWLQAQQHVKDRNKYKKLIMYMCTMYCLTYHLGFILPIRKQFK